LYKHPFGLFVVEVVVVEVVVEEVVVEEVKSNLVK
tara:strand:- start:678 stop:782 length:105 start_codon:yes stop_codon:yes gene_type:complete